MHPSLKQTYFKSDPKTLMFVCNGPPERNGLMQLKDLSARMHGGLLVDLMKPLKRVHTPFHAHLHHLLRVHLRHLLHVHHLLHVNCSCSSSLLRVYVHFHSLKMSGNAFSQSSSYSSPSSPFPFNGKTMSIVKLPNVIFKSKTDSVKSI